MIAAKTLFLNLSRKFELSLRTSDSVTKCAIWNPSWRPLWQCLARTVDASPILVWNGVIAHNEPTLLSSATDCEALARDSRLWGIDAIVFHDRPALQTYRAAIDTAERDGQPEGARAALAHREGVSTPMQKAFDRCIGPSPLP